jgi:hypothetical protein
LIAARIGDLEIEMATSRGVFVSLSLEHDHRAWAYASPRRERLCFFLIMARGICFER